MHSVLKVIYSSSSRCEWRSVLCCLLYARLIRVSCVILTFILLSVTRVNLIWLCTVGIMGRLSHMSCLYCFDIIWCVLSCSSESIYKSKSYRKSKRIPAYGLLEFYWIFNEKFDAGNRCRQCIKNVIKLCYYLSGSFLCFQVLTAYWTACEPLSWINRLSSHVRPFFPDSDRKRGAGSRGEWRWWWPS
jgi:hypothetical protein